MSEREGRKFFFCFREDLATLFLNSLERSPLPVEAASGGYGIGFCHCAVIAQWAAAYLFKLFWLALSAADSDAYRP